MGLARVCAAALAASAVFMVAGGADRASAAPMRSEVRPVPSLTPKATATLWRALVQRRRTGRFRTSGECRPLRAVFYAGTDWLRLATKLAATASPCADYSISVPPLVSDKTQPRADQAWRIRALGPNFHALAEINMSAWGTWVSTNASTWYAAGVEARRRMVASGYDVALGDGWALNELSSAVRQGTGSARANARAFVHGLYSGDGSTPTAGAVFISGMSQATGELSVYQARLQDWLEDEPFWADMAAYVSDWSQELYGDMRTYAVPGAALAARRDALNEYLQHELVLSRAGGSATARSFLESAWSPLANAAWQYDSAFGWTDVPAEQMKHFVSAQTYALRSFGAAGARDHFGFAWALKNATAMPSADFTAQSGEILDRLAAAIRDSAEPVDPADPGIGACGPLGQNLWCGADLDGASFNAGWQSFATWKPSVLAFTTASQGLTAGAASAPLTVQLRTYSGVALTAGAPLTATVSSSSEDGRFSTAATGPWTPSLALTIPSGSSSVSFYYQDTAAGSPTLTAAAAGKEPAVQSESVSPAALARVVVGPSSASLLPGETQAFTATGADLYGNAVAAGPVTWAVTAGTPGTIGPAGLFTAGSKGGSGSVLATAGGISGTAAVTVRGVKVTSVSYALSYHDVLVRTAIVDPNGNPLAGASVSIAVYRNGVLYASRSGTTAADGRLTTTLWNAPSGCYTTTVKSISATSWDGVTPANQYCR